MNADDKQTYTKGSFWKTLHPLTITIYVLIVIIISVTVNHPLPLAIVFLAVFAAVISAGEIKTWARSVKIFIWMILVFTIINVIGNNDGVTVLFSFEGFPILNRVTVSLENIIFSAVMAVRLLVIYSLFIFFNKAMDGDSFLAMFTRVFPRSGIMAAMAAKTMPSIALRLRKIWETQRIRGVRFGEGKRSLAAAKERLPLLRALLYSVLEDSFNMGESIQARAYGSGKRTFYHKYIFQRRDFLTLFFLTATSFSFVFIFITGLGGMDFFPLLSSFSFDGKQLLAAVSAGLFLGAPALISWGFDKWDFLKWKI